MATTPNYGWDTPDDTDFVSQTAAYMRTLGDDIDATVYANQNATGLILVKSQTIGTAVSSVTVTNAFSADYENYKITISGGALSTGTAALQLQLGSSTTGYYNSRMGVNYSSATFEATSTNNGSSFATAGNSTTDSIRMNIELLQPFLAKHTIFSGARASTIQGDVLSGIHQVATSYTGFTITPTSGTLTGGTIKVYGYK